MSDEKRKEIEKCKGISQRVVLMYIQLEIADKNLDTPALNSFEI